MNLKPVEMQIAIPRTQEATQIQQQLNHKPTHDQQLAAQLSSKQAEALQQKPNEVNKTHDSRIMNDSRGSGQGNGQSGKQKQSSSQDPSGGEAGQAKHPYKGKHIDFTL
jgi:hypothetical protein